MVAFIENHKSKLLVLLNQPLNFAFALVTNDMTFCLSLKLKQLYAFFPLLLEENCAPND